MKQFFVFIFILMLTSCEYFNVKKTSSDAILEEELKAFNWNDVDIYPSFSECTNANSKEDKKLCFQNTITVYITDYLEKESILVTQDIADTLMLHFQISKYGDVSLVETKMNDITKEEIPEMETLLLQSLDALPDVYPAIKRGQPVTTEFKLPLIIIVD